tara:strand:- start:463 stop:594 length:132 start_codon:yes stop_codon:yes gene_type:complete
MENKSKTEKAQDKKFWDSLGKEISKVFRRLQEEDAAKENKNGK